MHMQVRSRTGQELKDGISTMQARGMESKLFRTHPELKHVAKEFQGVPALSNKLVQIQAERIQSHLPALQKQVTKHSNLLCTATSSLTIMVTQRRLA